MGKLTSIPASQNVPHWTFCEGGQADQKLTSIPLKCCQKLIDFFFLLLTGPLQGVVHSETRGHSQKERERIGKESRKKRGVARHLLLGHIHRTPDPAQASVGVARTSRAPGEQWWARARSCVFHRPLREQGKWSEPPPPPLQPVLSAPPADQPRGRAERQEEVGQEEIDCGAHLK